MSGPGTLHGTHCLVLGAGGFIGTHLCRALHRAGAQVHGFGRPPFYPASLPPIRFTTADFTDRAALAWALDGADTVFHLLGGTAPEISNKDPAADLATSILPSVHLLEACRNAGIRRLVFVSSGGTVYGIPRSSPISEDAPTDPISAYGINKLAVEKYAALYARMGGFRAVTLRVANPFGPFQKPFRRQGFVAATAAALLADRPVEIWGDGSVVRDYLFAPDLADAMLAAAAYEGAETVFNIGSGEGRSLLDVVHGLAGAIGRAPSIAFKPSRTADVPSNVLDIARARAELGWAPGTAFPDALRQTIAWLADPA